MTTRDSVVILAAGLGRRFGSGSHKSLADVDGQGGTLPRLLRQLRADAAVADIAVVVGAHADSVSAIARETISDVHLVTNPEPAAGGPAGSVVAAMRHLPPSTIWVLLADTVYDDEFLQAMWTVPRDRAAVAVHRPRRPAADPVTDADVPVVVRDGLVASIGPGFPRDHEMAPAVRWNAEHWPLVLACAHQPTQWRIIAEAMTSGALVQPYAMEVPATSFFDVDTPEDLVRARTRLQAC